ncbi:hypothetical protein D5086_033525, partial [Populus alba]
KNQSTKSQLILVIFSSLFRISFSSFSSNLPNLKLGFTRAADDRSGMWMAGSATSLFLLHFYAGGEDHRHLQQQQKKTHKQQSVFIFFFPLQICFSLICRSRSVLFLLPIDLASVFVPLLVAGSSDGGGLEAG